MVYKQLTIHLVALALLQAVPEAAAHDHVDHNSEMKEMGMAMASTAAASMIPSATANGSMFMGPESYFSYPAMSGLMMGHIVLMTIAWILVLPIGEPYAEADTKFF